MKNLFTKIVDRNGFFIVVIGIFISSFLYASTAFCFTRRPDAGKGPTEVKFSVFIIDIDDVSDANQSFTANVYYSIEWSDRRLAHTNKFNKIMDLNKIWNPRIQIINQQKIWITLPEIVTISPNGEITYRQRVWGSFSQPLKLRDFPFDKQTFNIQFVSIGYEKNDVKFVDVPNYSGIAKPFSVADWKITGWKKKPFDYITVPGQPLPAALQFSIFAQRKPNYFITTAVLPLVLIVLMSWTVFWVDPKLTGTQMSIAMTSMLTLIAFRFAIVSSLPNISYLTRLDLFILASTIIVFASLVEVVTSSFLAFMGRLELARKLDKLSRYIFPSVFVIVSLATLLL